MISRPASLGSAFQPEWVFAHAQHDLQAAQRYTAVFDDFVDNVKDKRMLLDHVLISPGLLTNQGLRKVPHSGTVHHGEYNDHLANGGKKREDRPRWRVGQDKSNSSLETP